jgi:4-hydroxybenzoate polyprenyltransferase
MASSVILTAPPKANFVARLFQTLELIKFSHSVFALPFALASMLVASNGLPGLWVLGWILWCLVSARTAAMAFNRWADWDFDRFNPRTKRRSQLGSRRLTMVLCIFSLIAFIFGSAELNRLCLVLCPLACVIILGYSLAKRFTAYSHAWLGIALAIAPIGAWVAVRGTLFDSFLPWIMGAAVWCWVFGFDLIYATQDVEFDRQAKLYSFPARYGVQNALTLAKLLHAVTWLLLVSWGWLAQLSPAYWFSMAFVLVALIFEHLLCSFSKDLARINMAFFHMNALVGLFLIIGVMLSLYAPTWPFPPSHPQHISYDVI